VNGYPADDAAVTDLLAAVGDTLQGELVARSPSSHARLGVDADSGRVVRVLGADGVLAEVIAGKQGKAFGTVYVRRSASDQVYQVRNDLSTVVRRTVIDWRDKTIFQAQPIEIGAVSVTRDGNTYRLERDPVWTFANGEVADSQGVSRLLGRLTSVVTQGAYFATREKADSLDFSHPDRRLVVEGLGGDTVLDLSMIGEESRFWVHREGDPSLYQLFEWRANELTPVDSTLRVKLTAS